MNKRLIQAGALLLPLSLLFGASVVAAQTPLPDTAVLTTVLQMFQDRIARWEEVMRNFANGLYWGLVLISMVWTFGAMAIRQTELPEFFAELVKFTFTTGMFWWLLTNSREIGDSIVATFRQLASEASGQPTTLSPSDVLDIGFDILSMALGSFNSSGYVQGIFITVLAIGLLVLIALVAIQMTVLIISAWVMAYAGIVFLGFGGGRWTQDMAINYYKAMLQVGVNLFGMILIVGIGRDVLNDGAATLRADLSIMGMAVLMVAALVFYMLATSVPSMLASVVTGGNLPIGGSPGAAAAAMAGIAAAATTLSSVTRELGSVVQSAAAAGIAAPGAAASIAGSAAGMAGAVSEAFGAAREAASSGTGAFEGGKAESTIGGAIQMMAEVGKQLGAGAGAIAQEKLQESFSELKGTFAEAKEGGLGARLAENINPTLEGSGLNASSAEAAARDAFSPDKGRQL